METVADFPAIVSVVAGEYGTSNGRLRYDIRPNGQTRRRVSVARAQTRIAPRGAGLIAESVRDGKDTFQKQGSLPRLLQLGDQAKSPPRVDRPKIDGAVPLDFIPLERGCSKRYNLHRYPRQGAGSPVNRKEDRVEPHHVC